MDDSINVSNEEISDEPPLERLANSLHNLKAVNPFVSIELNEYDNSVCINLLLRCGGNKRVPHQVFRIYDPKKPVSERNVADNRIFIADYMKHPRCCRQIRESLEYLGYKHFHNPYSDYIEKRFREHINSKTE